jgi:tRNA pseudouridine38-40 synthase
MRQAARGLVGRLDATSLASQLARDRRLGSSATTTRTILAADWLEPDGPSSPLLLFEVAADAFVRQMVRTLVGSLLWVGRGRWTPDQFLAALAAADRRAAGPAAPAVGLSLQRIDYDDDDQDEDEDGPTHRDL